MEFMAAQLQRDSKSTREVELTLLKLRYAKDSFAEDSFTRVGERMSIDINNAVLTETVQPFILEI